MARADRAGIRYHVGRKRRADIARAVKIAVIGDVPIGDIDAALALVLRGNVPREGHAEQTARNEQQRHQHNDELRRTAAFLLLFHTFHSLYDFLLFDPALSDEISVFHPSHFKPSKGQPYYAVGSSLDWSAVNVMRCPTATIFSPNQVSSRLDIFSAVP